MAVLQCVTSSLCTSYGRVRTWEAERVEDEAGEGERQQRLAAGLELAVAQLLRPVPDDAQLRVTQRDLLQQVRQLRLLVRQLHLHEQQTYNCSVSSKRER